MLWKQCPRFLIKPLPNQIFFPSFLVLLTLHARRALICLQLFIPRRFILLSHDDPTYAGKWVITPADFPCSKKVCIFRTLN